MAENKRDPQADLALCEAATPGPWTGECGSLVNWRDGTFTMEFIPNRGGKPQYDADLNFMAMAREALPYWIVEAKRLRAELATQLNFQRGVECQFCGVSFDLPEPDDDGEVYRQHALTCEKSPVVQEVERLRKIIDDATGYSKDGDGTDLLCKALYGRPGKVADWLGGSEAKMLHDAAKEVERLRAENERLREQSEESALARLRAWVQQREGFRTAVVSVEGCQDAEMLELIDICHQATNKREVVVVWNKPIESDKSHLVGVGTEDKPASLGEMVEGALERWAELYGEDKE